MSDKERRTRIAAYGLIQQDDRMLLCRISPELPKWEGQWTLPGGGIEFGEDPEQAMRREVLEETGFVVAAAGVATIDSFHDMSGTVDFHGIRILYNAQLRGGTLRHEVNGTTDYCQWCTRSDLQELPLVEVARLGVQLLYT